MKLTERGNATLELAIFNEKSGTSHACWCEGGDAGWDDEVYNDMLYWRRTSQEDNASGMRPSETMQEIIKIFDSLDFEGNRMLLNRVFDGNEEEVLENLKALVEQRAEAACKQNLEEFVV